MVFQEITQNVNQNNVYMFIKFVFITCVLISGDIDFYPNGVQPLPPGCFDIVCAHTRAPELYAESVYPGNENNFLGVKCSSLFALNSNSCRGPAFPMGFATPQNLKGNFFLKTNDKGPYGLNAVKGFQPVCHA